MQTLLQFTGIHSIFVGAFILNIALADRHTFFVTNLIFHKYFKLIKLHESVNTMVDLENLTQKNWLDYLLRLGEF